MSGDLPLMPANGNFGRLCWTNWSIDMTEINVEFDDLDLMREFVHQMKHFITTGTAAEKRSSGEKMNDALCFIAGGVLVFELLGETDIAQRMAYAAKIAIDVKAANPNANAFGERDNIPRAANDNIRE